MMETVLPDKPRVLLVDDVPDNLRMLSDVLEDAGYMVMVATSGQSAIERLGFMLPDVILLDAVMPGMDGFETCRRIKADPRTADTPVVFMTGLTDSEHILRGFQSGGVDYVTKPVDPMVVLARIQAHVRNARRALNATDAIEAVAHAVIVVDEQAQPVWETRLARVWMERFYPALPHGVALLPEALAQWVRAAMPGVQRGEDSEPFTVSRADRSLSVRLARSQRSAEYLLLLETSASDADMLAQFSRNHHLTAREMDVIHWLVRGKTNRDISDILGMSPRTVGKHLEHIYVKLGVETRAAATSMVLKHLGPVR